MALEQDLRAAVAGELGLADPAALGALSPDELAALRGAVAEARTRQKAALDDAITRALDTIPWVLRGAVRKVLFP